MSISAVAFLFLEEIVPLTISAYDGAALGVLLDATVNFLCFDSSLTFLTECMYGQVRKLLQVKNNLLSIFLFLTAFSVNCIFQQFVHLLACVYFLQTPIKKSFYLKTLVHTTVIFIMMMFEISFEIKTTLFGEVMRGIIQFVKEGYQITRDSKDDGCVKA